MAQQDLETRFPTVGDGSGICEEDTFYQEELQLASRNRGIPLEGLRYPVTPTGMHYLLIHFDIPEVDATNWQLNLGGLVSKSLSLSIDEIKARPPGYHSRDYGVRGQWQGASKSSSPEPALDAGGHQHSGMDRHAVTRGPGRGWNQGRCGRDSFHRPG